MKIGIITLNGYVNYGNRLQNYALVKTLQKMGHEVDTIVVREISSNLSIIDYILMKRPILDYLRVPKRLISKFRNKKYREFLETKEIKLKRFSKEHLNEVFVDVIELESLSIKYDYFIAGSDQIWNERWTNDYYFLDFSPKEKNISYAASIGNDEISEDYNKYLKQKLTNFKSLSVREKLPVDIIESLTAISHNLVLDPTLLITTGEWNFLAKLSQIRIEEDYLLTYFLGQAPTNEIRIFARENKLKIKNLYNPISIDVSYLSSSIEDFLKLFSGASYVMTDSFHGTVFSILFKKQFIAYSRDDMNSRLYSLFNLLEIHGRLNSIAAMKSTIDFTEINLRLKSHMIKSINFLEEAII